MDIIKESKEDYQFKFHWSSKFGFTFAVIYNKLRLRPGEGTQEI